MNKKSSIKEDARNMENRKADNISEKRLTEVTGNRVSDHYARNICIKVSLKIVVPWNLLTTQVGTLLKH